MTLPPKAGPAAELRGGRPHARSAVLVLHGGQEQSSTPTSRRQLSYLRMLDMYVGLRRTAPDCAVYVLRHGVRGWNATNGSGAPVAEAWDALDTIASTHPGAPVALLGHSMGGRTAVAAAAHPSVAGVCALAPWLPESEPLPDAASSAHFVLAHGTDDRTTSPLLTLQYAERLRARGRESHASSWRQATTPCFAAPGCGTASRSARPSGSRGTGQRPLVLRQRCWRVASRCR